MKPQTRFALIGFLFLIAWAPSVYAAEIGVLPVGTVLNVRTTQPIYAESSMIGMRLKGIVDDPVALPTGEVVVPRGSPATLEVTDIRTSSTLKGRDRVFLKVLSVRVGTRTYQVSAGSVEVKGPSEGKRTARKALGGAGIGAAVGGLLGGGTGAAVGATAGAATGTAVAGSGKTHLRVPAETRLEFRLSSPVRVER